MELGEKLRQARLEAGLSQRQLCGGEITRNMLSQIEHGSARPSMETLRYLAGQLGRPVSYFLDEDALSSPNQAVMEQARNAFDAGLVSEAVRTLEKYRGPDPVYDRERKLLEILLCLSLAQSAMEQGKALLARALLEDLQISGYAAEVLEPRRLLLLGQLPGISAKEICGQLPSLDRELLLRGQAAMEAGEYDRGLHLLGAMENQADPDRCLLNGRLLMAKGDYSGAADSLLLAQDRFPNETAVLLEQCFRELGDFKQAYFYACRQRETTPR
jgi:transcriptional regulator with XRE-family HTH domain